jgi:hypothetical protein
MLATDRTAISNRQAMVYQLSLCVLEFDIIHYQSGKHCKHSNTLVSVNKGVILRQSIGKLRRFFFYTQANTQIGDFSSMAQSNRIDYKA